MLQLNQRGDGVLLESPEKPGNETRCAVKSPITALEEYARGKSLDVSFELINQHGTPHNPWSVRRAQQPYFR